MATWPTSLPQPISDGYGLTPEDSGIRTDMEVGAARVRRRTRARNDRIDVRWLLTDAQMAAFRAWFDDDATGVSGGSAWFYIRLNIGTGGMQTVEARFVNGFKRGDFTPPDTWQVTAQLEIR